MCTARTQIGWFLVVATASLLVFSYPAGSKPPVQRADGASAALSIDNATYINANRILMFVTNHGNYGRDLAGTFGNDFGTYYPYTSVADIESGVNARPVNYASGLWIGGVDSVSGDTLVTVSEFSSEYVPGPMAGGTFQTDRPEFRVYKLYADSLEGNPNQDYLDWPVDQGAPVDGGGHPDMRGDQMLWTVYNDADPAQHTNNNGETAPLGIEVHQTVWASDEAGDIELPLPDRIAVDHPDTSRVAVTVLIEDNTALTGHDYAVVTDTLQGPILVWYLIDFTTSDTLLAEQTDFTGNNTVVTDGFLVQVMSRTGFRSFEVVANGAGPIDPPESCGALWQGFPAPTDVDPDGYPTDGQQVGDGHWLISTGSSTNPLVDWGSYEAFLWRTIRDDDWYARLGYYDWEIRFTGSNDNPGVGGGYAWDAFGSGAAYWVPFEIWRIGANSPDDPSDDLRLIPWVFDEGGDLVFWMSSWGPRDGSGVCGPSSCEHEISDGHDDPSTDWIYWTVPLDTTPGDAAYQVFETAMTTDPQNWPGDEERVMDRMVLVNWNGDTTQDFSGGATVPSGYNQDMPEPGTIFRLCTLEPVPGETFSFSATPAVRQTTGVEGLAVYIKYVLVNKGDRILKNVIVGSWHDVDLGSAGDDLVGCDTIEDRFFCYNAVDADPQYPEAAPAIGWKVIEGPIVPSPGDTATVDGLPIPDFKNLGMYSFQRFIGGDDPDNYAESYATLWGLRHKESGWPPIVYGDDTVQHVYSGDPVTGTGWLDFAPDDRRMLAGVGPFDLPPGGTQQLLLKMAVGQGADRLSSITSMREILEHVPSITGVDDGAVSSLPQEFRVEQNYPNPFNPATTINYSLAARSEVEIAIFNLLGQRVATLHEGVRAAGDHAAVWRGTDDAGGEVATGVYFYRVRAGDKVSTKKMLLLK